MLRVLSRRDWWLYALSVIIWGSTWIMINFQLGVVPAEVSLVYRYLIASVLLMGWCWISGRRLRMSPAAHGYALALGVLLFSLNYLMAYNAQKYITSALNALAFSSMVWMNILNSRLFFKTPFQGTILVGSAMGMVGVALIFWPEIDHLTLNDTTVMGATLCLAGALTASLGNMVSQKAQSTGLPVAGSTAWAMAYGTVFLALFALIQGKPFLFEWSVPYVSSLLYLSIFGSIIGFLCYLSLLGSIGAARAGYVVVMFPIVAIFLSILFEGLRPGLTMWLGMALALAGNALVLWGRQQPASATVSTIRRPA